MVRHGATNNIYIGEYNSFPFIQSKLLSVSLHYSLRFLFITLTEHMIQVLRDGVAQCKFRVRNYSSNSFIQTKVQGVSLKYILGFYFEILKN